MQFDLSQYETVKERKKRFYADYPDGRIIVEMTNLDLDEKAIAKATVYLNQSDQEKRTARATGFALELRDKTLQKTKYGKEYESVNYSSWVENAEESAIGRALDNAGYSSNNKPSKDEMQKAQRNIAAQKKPGQFESETLIAAAAKSNIPIEIVKTMIKENYKVEKLHELTMDQYNELLNKVGGK